MSTKVIQMHNFFINFFKATNRMEADIYVLLDSILPVAKSAGLAIYEDFDNTLESLLGPLLTYPNYFELSTDISKIILKDSETLEELVKFWTVDESIMAAIKQYMHKYDDPMMNAGVLLDYAEENEKYISSSTKYIDWLWDRLEQNVRTDTRLLRESWMRTTKDLANTVRISNLHTLLSRYYSKNMMSYYGKDRENDAYIFHYTRKGKQRYFKVEMTKTCDIVGDRVSYRVTQHSAVATAPYFPDIILEVPSVLLEEREMLYNQLQELFLKARDISLSYDAIAYDLGRIYGKIDDPRD